MKNLLFLFTLLSLCFLTKNLHAQDRDIRAQRLVLDDGGTDSTTNTVTIQSSSSLLQNVVLTIPDPGSGTAEFMLTSPGSGGFWQLGGNNGTIPGTSFLGTSDSTALQIQVRGTSGTTANSLILNENGSLQRDTGGNARGANAVDLQIARSAATEVAGSVYSVIGGGQNNGIASTAEYGTIGGGLSNVISENATYGTIGGGTLNTIDTSVRYAVIGAGGENSIGKVADYSTIGGGYRNAIDSTSYQSVIGGGEQNHVRSGAYIATIGGGFNNRVELGSHHGTIAGGEDNAIYDSARYSTIGGGVSNRIRYGADYATIGGGTRNSINSDGDYGTIGGGFFNEIGTSSIYSTIGGGRYNVIYDSAEYAVIGGGRSNLLQAHSSYSAIGGGWGNSLDGENSVIPGGRGLTLNADRSFGFIANGGGNDMTISESDVAVFGNVDLWLANNNGTASQLRFYEGTTGTGNFPASSFYTSFEAPALGTDIEYILPAAKPTAVGQVLEVSAINGSAVTLTWGTDNTIAGRDGDALPTAVAVPEDSSVVVGRITRLEAQIAAREQLLQTQNEQIRALQADMQTMKKHAVKRASNEAESNGNAGARNAE